MKSVICFGILLLVSLQIGCGVDELRPVSGIVTLDGEPLGGADIIFVPQESGYTNASARTNGNGMYELFYINGEGTAPGSYKVVISKSNESQRGEIETVPAKYNRFSDMVVRVEADGENRFDFALEGS
ncbi:carboxypeptidase-like regulatory domain-containing protein [Bremerella sp. P1]|uniref:carboxypeptidase-like regulatory domain-containing protein n=1 Tax=Bremerella sp. P1 TaxID=3026424 RepID=UPI002368CFF8|nr:carboxypeptidase-like regulatory domain-containing protein [Bremerella sp. P1]WDI43742.1 carboxypeptidase-like regulatory domain-containing protein [Bremerella sp. P1]